MGGICQQKLYEIRNYLISYRYLVKCQVSFVVKHQKYEMRFCVSGSSWGCEQNYDMESTHSLFSK
jgi:hypothetical protein